MWFQKRPTFEKELWTTVGENKALTAQVASQQAYLDWLTIRVTQLEKERAQLLFNYTGVKVEVPVVSRAPVEQPEDVLSRAMTFADIGDKAAKELGISFNTDGTLHYAK